MRAVSCTRPGQLEYHEMKPPVLTAGHALIRIRRIGICGTDLHAYTGTQPYFNYPRILGHELAADLIDADAAEGFVPGEPITFIPYFNCGKCLACRTGKPNCCAQIKVCGVHIDGGMAEYLAVPSHSLVHARGLTYDQLALIEPLAIGAHAIRRAAIQANEFVLVMGAGPIGLGLLESARLAGAHTIAMDLQSSRLAFCRDKLQVPHTINVKEDDISARLMEITGGDMPSVVIDATGSLQAINNGLNWLAHGGRYILVGLQKEAFCFSHPEFHKRETTLMSSRNATREDFDYIINAIAAGAINPDTYITHRFAFDELATLFPELLNAGSGLIKAMVNID